MRPPPVILVADDDRDTRELYRACFDLSGYRTAEAETGAAALELAYQLLPDLLLTDWKMPDMDGLTIAARLRLDARTAGIRVLLLTGYPDEDLGSLALDAGIDRALVKPCPPRTMLREVRRILSKPSTLASPPSIARA